MLAAGSPPVFAAYRPYRATVGRLRRLTEHFVRVTFRCPDFVHFGTAGLDQRVKIVLPAADGSLSDVGQDDPAVIAAGGWYAAWRALPAEGRSPFRTYTVRKVDAAACEVDIDFVLHHDPGPAGQWAAGATPGDEVVLVGPDERSADSRVGIDWHPGTARRILLVGDETAVPAIGGIAESLGEDFVVDAFIEVPTTADVLELPTGCRARFTWIGREGRPHGEALIEAVTAWADESAELLRRAAAPRSQHVDDVDVDRELIWDSPADADGEFYAWIAGEAATVKTLRRLLVTDRGVDRRRVAFMGYWRLGQSERQE